MLRQRVRLAFRARPRNKRAPHSFKCGSKIPDVEPYRDQWWDLMLASGEHLRNYAVKEKMFEWEVKQNFDRKKYGKEFLAKSEWMCALAGLWHIRNLRWVCGRIASWILNIEREFWGCKILTSPRKLRRATCEMEKNPSTWTRSAQNIRL